MGHGESVIYLGGYWVNEIFVVGHKVVGSRQSR